MKKFFLFILLLYECHVSAAPRWVKNNRIDSLTQLLSTADHDSARLKIRYLIACETNTNDTAIWELLLSGARHWQMSLCEIGCMNRLGELYRARNEFSRMAGMFDGALLIAQRNNHKPEMLELSKKLQAHYSEKFDAKRTLYFLYKALKIAEELNKSEVILDLYSSLTVFYINTGDFQKGLDIQLKCLKKCRELKYGFGIASALLDIGTIYSRMGMEDQTIRYYLESRNYIYAVAGTIYAVQIYTSLGDAYRMKKQYDSADYFVDKGYQLACQLNDSRAVASTLVVKGLIAMDQKQFANAEQLALAALGTAKKIQFNAQMPSLYLLLERVYTERGQYKKALQAYKSYISFRDSLSNEATRKQAAEKEFSYSLKKKESEYKLLAQQGLIKDLRLRENETLLRQNRYITGGSVAALVILLLIVLLFIRQRKFRTEHQRIMLEQKLLRTQMNPHFVFNSLNSIQGFVMENDTRQAELYLSRFATLLRDLLDSNINDSLSVSEEIDILGAYLEMEELRFGTSFTYSVYVDDRIAQKKTQIPHLMIQPFVENAIWHGLLPKAGEKVLTIRFEYDSETTLKCTVEDNGVGREASAASNTTLHKKSLALGFVKQRMELIRKTYKINGGITIIDKKDPGNYSLGTIVVITVPILKT